MFDILKLKKRVAETEIDFIFDFERYPSRTFLDDMEVFRNVNLGIWKSASDATGRFRRRIEETKKREIVFNGEVSKQLKGGALKKPDYHDFKTLCSRILSNYFCYMFQHMKAAIEGQESIRVRVMIFDSVGRDYYIYHDEKRSVPDRIYFRISGPMLVGRMYGPWLYNGKVDASFVERSLVHEIEHHIDTIRGMYRKEYSMQGRIKNYMQLKPNQWLGSMTVLYEIFCNLYTEGIATFLETRYSQKMIFNLNDVQKYLNALEKIARTPQVSKAKHIWDNEFCPTGRRTSGEYYLGAFMCYFIGLSIMKRKGAKFLSVFSPETTRIKFDDLNNYINSKRVVGLGPLDPESFKETYSTLLRVNHHTEFIGLYSNACDYLGLKKPVKFFDMAYFKHLHRLANKFYERWAEGIDKAQSR